MNKMKVTSSVTRCIEPTGTPTSKPEVPLTEGATKIMFLWLC